MFLDKTRLFINAGIGGYGCLSFRREKFVPFGGPNGGDGGKGGDVYLCADANMTTLYDFKYRPHFKAEDGSPGQGKDRHGSDGNDLFVNVPCGTQVYRITEKNEKVLIADLVTNGEKILVAKGGRGGRGNASFKTQYNTAPRISEKGEPGEKHTLELELKLIADVGLVGYPNAGKSTLLSSITAAKPKIADYPFTTLSPNLGVCRHKNKTFVVADIPGLIEDAHKGKGLGIDFLRHIERTKMLLHIVDVFGSDGNHAWKNFMLVNRELEKYSKKLAGKPMIVALNKIDLTGSEKYIKLFKSKIKKKIKIFIISAAARKNITGMLDELIYRLSVIDSEELKKKHKISLLIPKKQPEPRKYVFEPEFGIVADTAGNFTVKGRKLERMVSMINFNQEDAVRRFQYILKKMGVEKALVRQGVKEGDIVKIGQQEFEFKPFKSE